MQTVLIEREVDNPLLTDALFYDGKGYAKVGVIENAVTRLGALAFIPKPDKKKPHPQPGCRYPHHEATAEDFKRSYEALYGRGAPAVDPSNEPVDTSLRIHDFGLAARIDRGDRLNAAINRLGKTSADMLIDMLVLGTPSSAYAAIMPSGEPNQRQVRSLNERRLAIIDTLAIMWGYSERPLDNRNALTP